MGHQSVCLCKGRVGQSAENQVQRRAVAGHGMSQVDRPAKHARSGGQWPRHMSKGEGQGDGPIGHQRVSCRPMKADEASERQRPADKEM